MLSHYKRTMWRRLRWGTPQRMVGWAATTWRLAGGAAFMSAYQPLGDRTMMVTLAYTWSGRPEILFSGVTGGFDPRTATVRYGESDMTQKVSFDLAVRPFVGARRKVMEEGAGRSLLDQLPAVLGQFFAQRDVARFAGLSSGLVHGWGQDEFPVGVAVVEMVGGQLARLAGAAAGFIHESADFHQGGRGRGEQLGELLVRKDLGPGRRWGCRERLDRVAIQTLRDAAGVAECRFDDDGCGSPGIVGPTGLMEPLGHRRGSYEMRRGFSSDGRGK